MYVVCVEASNMQANERGNETNEQVWAYVCWVMIDDI